MNRLKDWTSYVPNPPTLDGTYTNVNQMHPLMIAGFKPNSYAIARNLLVVEPVTGYDPWNKMEWDYHFNSVHSIRKVELGRLP